MTNYLEGLSDDQLAAVVQTDGPTLIYAGAGSGKTRVLTRRVAHIIKEGRAYPDEIVCITFTNKAADEMKSRLTDLIGQEASDQMSISTFHSLCAKLLRTHGRLVGVPKNFTIYDEGDSKKLLKEIIEDMGLDVKYYPAEVISSAISSAKGDLEAPHDYYNKHVKKQDSMEGVIHDVYLRYSKRLTKCEAIDFDDILVKAVQLVTKSTEGISHVRETIKYVLVDEYQDTNLAQSVFINALAKNCGRNICAVGDPRQSIYGWRGADYKIIMNFTNEYPDAVKHILKANYRSTHNIVNGAEAVILKNTMRPDYVCHATGEQGRKIQVKRFASAFEESREVINSIAQKMSTGKYDYSDFGILFRTNAMSRLFETDLINKKIPYKLIGALDFYSRLEVKDVLAYLRLAHNHSDDMAFDRVANVPTRSLGATSMKRIKGMAHHDEISLWDFSGNDKPDGVTPKAWAGYKKFVLDVNTLKTWIEDENRTLADLIRHILRIIGLEDHYLKDEKVGKERVENVVELINMAAEFVGPASETLEPFLEKIALMSNTSNQHADNRVEIMSLHQCKGLEYKVIYLVGMEEGILPHDRSMGDREQLEEERRICYVGMTRAKEELYMTYTSERLKFGKNMFMKPSRFFKEIDPKCAELGWAQ